MACQLGKLGPLFCQRAFERIQLSVARSTLQLDRHTSSYEDVPKLIGWPTLAWRRRRYKLLLLWRLLHGEGSPSLQASILPTVDQRTTQTLRKKNFSLPLYRTEQRQRSLSHPALRCGTLSHNVKPRAFLLVPFLLHVMHLSAQIRTLSVYHNVLFLTFIFVILLFFLFLVCSLSCRHEGEAFTLALATWPSFYKLY